VDAARRLGYTCWEHGTSRPVDAEAIAPRRRALLTTGGVIFEMMQKAARFGAAAVISRTSPTSLSVELAERRGITLIGYARPDRFDVYAGARRIAGVARASD
jgi:formate dehydrogenase accessory protein FdhD